MRTTARVLRGLGALAVLVAVVVGVPVLLVRLGLVPTELPSIGDIASTLSARDDGQLLRGVLAAGAWACWFVFTLATASETWAAVTARPALRLPGLRGVQGPVAALVAAVVVGLALTSSVAAPLATAASAHRPPLPVAAAAAQPAAAQPATFSPVVLADRVETTTRTGQNPEYVVQHRDTLWALAERHLGDPLRYSEIVALNPRAIGPDNRIATGTTLLLPSDAVGLGTSQPDTTSAPSSGTDVVVEPGDTLWTITQNATGDGSSWPTVWEANAGRTEPGGAVFDDPDLIRAGWTISVPATAEPRTAPSTPSAPDTPSEVPTSPTAPVPDPPPPTPTMMPTPEPTADGTSRPTPTPTAAPGTTASATATSAKPPTDERSDAGAPTDPAEGDELPGPVAAGLATALGAVSLLALGRYRRRQFRHRRPGHLLPAVPAQLRTTERALTTRAVTDIPWLDRALRRLVAAVQPGDAPDVLAVCVAADTITVVLTAASQEASAPWSVDGTGTRWSLQRRDAVDLPDEIHGRRHAPFPGLVAVGSTDAGEEWFIDLERAGVLRIGGDPARGCDLMRYLAAELAHNPWSEMLVAVAVGLGTELQQLNPDRLHLHDDPRLPVEDFCRSVRKRTHPLQMQSADALQARAGDLEPDAWAPRILLLATPGDDVATELEEELAHLGRRAGLALVTLSDREVPEPDMVVDAMGVLTIPALHLTLIGHQLSAEEAGPLAQLLAHAASAADAPDPSENNNSASGTVADGRPLFVDGLVDSVLPLPHGTYLRSAATTLDDVHLLAPATTPTGRQGATDSDPHLDADLADWDDSQCRRPKLTLLGAVRVDACGALPQRNPRRAFYTEVVAYLATRPDGATSEQYATALWPDEPDVVGKTKVRQSISVVRAWLGTDDDGTDFLPSGLTTAAGGRYRVTGALVDADLFRRLRARGLARGADGVADLERALGLVRGRPFELPDLRVSGVGGYGWLLDDGTRMDLELAATIVDVAHVVATHHLGNGEPGRAAEAAHVALRSGTFEDVPLLDLVAACDALGDRAEADAYVARILANHDAEVEEDLPPRTAELLFRRSRY